MLKQRAEYERMEQMEKEVFAAVERCLGQWTFFIPVEFFIVSQGYCESRDIIYDHSANSVLWSFYFLIKKELMFFTNGCPCPSLATRVLGKIEKLCTIENYKLKGYVQIEKIKNKKKSYLPWKK